MSLNDVFHPVLSLLGRFADKLRLGAAANGELDDLQTLLESLPLSFDEFGLPCNQLKNAQRYLVARERGAARWKLQALRQHLCSKVEAAPAVPRPLRRRPPTE